MKRPGMRRPIAPVEGFEWNPLRGYPRNAPCVCGMGSKIKKCCGKVDVVPHKIADLIRCMLSGDKEMFAKVVEELKAEEDLLKKDLENGNSNPEPTDRPQA